MPTYRYEISPNNRAMCQNKQCKDAGVKIMKGEFRFATLVTINEHDSWKYKHWGCVTPRQISNIIETIGGLEGLDIDNDLDILDGYEELEPWAQEKLKFSLRNGHVEDEDWKGDPELNRPGMRGITKKRTPKKKKGEDAEGEDNSDANLGEEATPSKPKAKKASGKGRTKQESELEDNHSSAPSKKAAGRKRKAAAEEDDEEEEDVKPKKKRAIAKSQNVKAEMDDDEEPLKPAAKRGKKVKQEEPDADVNAQLDDAEERAEESRSKKSSRPKVKSETAPAKKAPRSRKVKVEDVNESDGEDVKGEVESEDELAPSPPPVKKSKSRAVKSEKEDGTEPAKSTKKSRGDAAKAEDPASEPAKSKTRVGRGRKA